MDMSLFAYCKTFNICGIKFSRFTENDIGRFFFNFGGHNMLWLR